MKVLSQPVQATTFYRRGDREKYTELMTMLQEVNPQLFSYQLFDLDRDPGQRENLAARSEHAATRTELRARSLELVP